MIKAEKLLYQPNKTGSNLVVLFIVLNMIYTIFVLKHMGMSMHIGTFTMANILISLVGFLGSTKYGAYQIKWAYVGAGYSIIQGLRFLWLPEDITGSLRFNLTIIIIVSAIALLIGSVITIQKTMARQEFIKTHETAS